MSYKLRFTCGLWISSRVFGFCQGVKTTPGWKTINTVCYHEEPSLSRFFYVRIKENWVRVGLWVLLIWVLLTTFTSVGKAKLALLTLLFIIFLVHEHLDYFCQIIYRSGPVTARTGNSYPYCKSRSIHPGGNDL